MSSPSATPPSAPSATVIGLGPAGRAVAHRAAARGWRVTAHDPAGGSMPATVGAWAHQLPGWLPAGAVASRFRPEFVSSRGERRLLADDYVILDTAELAGLGGFEVRRDRADVVAVASGDDDFAIVATGAAPDPGADGPLPIRQIAFGHVFAEADVPEHLRVPVLMDFTVPDGAVGAGGVSGAGGAAGDLPATFSYRLPLGDGTWLIEETIVAARTGPAGGRRHAHPAETLHAHVRAMQGHRLAALGLDPVLATATETVDFPLGPARLPVNRPPCDPGATRVARFGAAAGWMHPATGYSVGMVLAGVDRFLDALATEKTASPPGGRVRAWLLRRGLHVLLGFDAAMMRDFFDAFFRLRDSDVRAYLTGATAVRTMLVMLRVAVPLGRRNPAALRRLLTVFCDGEPLA